MKSMKNKKTLLIFIGFVLMLCFDVLLMLNAIWKMQRDDALKSGVNYLGHSFLPTDQLIVSIVIGILLGVCAFFFAIEKRQPQKKNKLSGKQKKRIKQYDTLQKQNNFRKF